MNWFLSLFRKHQPVAPGEHPCSRGHLSACRCFVDESVKHDPAAHWIVCGCANCDDFRRLRVLRKSEMMLEAMYERHIKRQVRSRRRMQSVDPTAVSEEMARPTVVDPEFAVVTLVEEVA